MPKLEKRITDLQSHLKNKMVDTPRWSDVISKGLTVTKGENNNGKPNR